MRSHLYKTLTLILIAASLSCNENTNLSSEIEPQDQEKSDAFIKISQAQFEQSKMALGSFEQKQFPIVVTANGMIDVPPENRAAITATMGGYIKTTPLLVGDKVKKGQVLVTLENPEFVSMQQEYMETNEQLSYLKAEYDRQVTMKKENITSEKSYLKAESDYKTAVARHAGLEKQLQMLNISPALVKAGTINSIVRIYAPISGSITKVNVTRGSYVSPSNVIMEIIDTDHIHLELNVFEKDIMSIKKGQNIDFKIPEASLETYKANVHLVGTSIEPNRTIKVHGHLEDDANHNFLTGMFVNADIITNTHLANTLPSETVVEIDNSFHVLILEKIENETYYFKSQEVVIKNTYNNFAELRAMDNLNANTQFLVKGAFNLMGE